MPPRSLLALRHRLRARLILSHNLPAEIHERLVHIRPPPRARLVVWGVSPPLTHGEGSGAGDGAVFFEVGLVADNHEGHAWIVFDADYLFAQLVKLVKTTKGCDGEDEKEALAGFHVELSRRG